MQVVRPVSKSDKVPSGPLSWRIDTSMGMVSAIVSQNGREVGSVDCRRLGLVHPRSQCGQDLKDLTVMVGRPIDGWEVFISSLSEPLRNKGIGLRLYEMALKAVARHGGALMPNRCTPQGSTSGMASRVWQALQRRWPHVGTAIWGGVSKHDINVAVRNASRTMLQIDSDTDIEGQALYRKTEPIKAVQMGEPFQVQTLEGPLEGDAGDWLAEGSDGERWPIEQAVFEHSYVPVASRVAARFMQFSAGQPGRLSSSRAP